VAGPRGRAGGQASVGPSTHILPRHLMRSELRDCPSGSLSARHVPVKPAAARRSAVAPPTAIGLEAPVRRRRRRRAAPSGRKCQAERLCDRPVSPLAGFLIELEPCREYQPAACRVVERRGEDDFGGVGHRIWTFMAGLLCCEWESVRLRASRDRKRDPCGAPLL
jgi:hypothetical protein